MKNVALVLSSGGARGIAHIGVINHLVHSGYNISSIAGTSMGALVGGMYANGTLPAFSEWLLRFTKMDVIRFLDLAVGTGGIIKGEKIVKALEPFIGHVNIEDLPIPFACVASDIHNRKEIVYKSGSLLKAVRASISIPTVFRPIIDDQMLLVDGGVMNPIPLDIIRRHHDDLLVAVNVNADVPYQRPAADHLTAEQEKHYSRVRTIINEKWSEAIETRLLLKRKTTESKERQVRLFDVISDSIRLAQDRITALSLEKYPPDILVNISYSISSIFDFYKSEELIEAGRAACEMALCDVAKPGTKQTAD